MFPPEPSSAPVPPELLIKILGFAIAAHLDDVIAGDLRPTQHHLDPALAVAGMKPTVALLFTSVQVRTLTQKILSELLGIPLEECGGNDAGRLLRYMLYRSP